MSPLTRRRYDKVMGPYLAIENEYDKGFYTDDRATSISNFGLPRPAFILSMVCKVMVGGDFSKMIKELRSSSKLLRGEVFIVQPAISKSEPMPEKIQEVLAATETYVKLAGKVNSLRILGSA